MMDFAVKTMEHEVILLEDDMTDWFIEFLCPQSVFFWTTLHLCYLILELLYSLDASVRGFIDINSQILDWNSLINLLPLSFILSLWSSSFCT